MRKYQWCFLGMLSFLLAAPAIQAGQHNIGFVDIGRVFENTEEGKKILGNLKIEFEKKQKELDEKMKAFEEKAKQFQQQQAVMKDEVRAQKAQELGKEQRDLQQLFLQYQNDINERKARALVDFEGKVVEIVQKIAQREGVDYVLRREMLLFGPEKMDLTNEVIREYDKRYQAAGAKKEKGK